MTVDTDDLINELIIADAKIAELEAENRKLDELFNRTYKVIAAAAIREMKADFIKRGVICPAFTRKAMDAYADNLEKSDEEYI